MKTKVRRGFSFRQIVRLMATLAAILTVEMWIAGGHFKYGVSSAQVFSTERARQADEFIDSIGVNVHLHYNDTAYASYEGIIKPKLRELGLRHLRDGVTLERPDKEAMMHELESFGFKFLLIADPRATSAQQAREFVKRFSSVEMVEGPNEPDLNLGTNWAAAARSYQRELYQQIKNDPATEQVSVLAPSLAIDRSFDQLRDISQWIDYASLHTIDLGPPADQVFLILSGTGIRYRSSLSTIHGMLAGITTQVVYAGPQSGLPGMDQLQMCVPRDLIGRGEIDVEVWVDGQQANIVKIKVK